MTLSSSGFVSIRFCHAQADRRALNITLNSIGTELTRDDRRKLYSNFGLLYPHGQVRPPPLKPLAPLSLHPVDYMCI